MMKFYEDVVVGDRVEIGTHRFAADEIKAFAKAYIGRNLFGNEGSSRVMLMEDTQVKKAMTVWPEAEKIAKSMSSLK